MDNSRYKEKSLLEAMKEAKRLLCAGRESFTLYYKNIEELAARLKEERFHLAVLGQFKRGKSSLINALLGGEFLPTSSIPLTSLPTIVSWGNVRRATIVFQTGQIEQADFEDDELLGEYLSKFVSEQENHLNWQKVEEVKVEYPAEVLASGGITLIDTPGIGSTYKHNTETTLNFLNKCDAALFVISADPPITENEISFLQTVSCHVKKIFFVLNKADYLSLAEREKVIVFIQSVLHKEIAQKVPIYVLSARQALLAKKTNDKELIEQSGIRRLEADLTVFFQTEKKAVLVNAIKEKFAAILQQAALDIKLGIRTLEMPLSELTAKQKLLAKKLEEIERQYQAASDLLSGDKKRTMEFLENQASVLRNKAKVYLWNIVEKKLNDYDRQDVEQVIHKELEQTIPPFFDKELALEAEIFSNYITNTLNPHWQRANEIISATREAAAAIFAIEFTVVENTEFFQMKRQPYWVKDKWQNGLGVVPNSWIDALLPKSMRRARVEKRLEQYVDMLVNQNVENLRWSLLQNMETAFLNFAMVLKTRLTETVNGINKTIEVSIAMRQDKTQEVELELCRLNDLMISLQQLMLSLENVENSKTKSMSN